MSGHRGPYRRKASSLAAEAYFRARLEEEGALLLESGWLGALEPHRVRCVRGHEVTPRPNHIKQGGGICRTCAGRNSRETECEFRAKLASQGVTLLEPAYLGALAKHRIVCTEGHHTSPCPSDIRQRSTVCGSCSKEGREYNASTGEVGRKARSQTSEMKFRARVSELGGVVLEEKWLGNHAPHRVRCAAGHECSPRPNNVARWGLCRVCRYANPPRRQDSFQAETDFRDSLVKLGATLLDGEWRGREASYRVLCSAGHECEPSAHGVLNGQGVCRICVGQLWDAFYVVADDVNAVIKFGITSRDARHRLAEHKRDGFDRVIRLHLGLPGNVAPELERTTLSALCDAREQPIRGREYFPARVLPLVLDLVDNHPTIRAERSA